MNSLLSPKPPKGDSKATILSFSYKKIDFAGRNCAAKFVCVKTVSGKVVRPIRLCRMVGGRCPLLREILGQNDPPSFKNGDFHSIYLLVAAQPLELAKKVQL